MLQSSNNPEGNKLGQGVTHELLADAVNRSGYPLQTIVAKRLSPHFSVVEEWGYVDENTETQRTIDIFAFRNLRKNEATTSDNFEPGLVVLVECKRSDLPYVFFESANSLSIPDFPRVAGFKPNVFGLYALSDRMYRHIPVASALGLDQESFICFEPPVCVAVSKTERKGQTLILSGADPFNTIVLPLQSAIEHAIKYFRYSDNQDKFYPCLVFGLCVLDAPMVIAHGEFEETQLTLAPWVRIVRQETQSNGRSKRFYVVDVVHREYLNEFVTNKLLPFANTFAERVLNKHEILKDMSGAVKDIVNWNWQEIVPPYSLPDY